MEEVKLDIGKLVKRVGETGGFISYDEPGCYGCGKCTDLYSMGLWS